MVDNSVAEVGAAEREIDTVAQLVFMVR